MKERSIKELLEILYINTDIILKDTKYGLCYIIHELFVKDKITIKEDIELFKYIYNNQPRFKYIFKSGYFWKPGKIKPRKKWIKKHIKKNS